MKTIRAGLVGLGHIARTAHLPALRADGRVEIVGLCSRNGAALAEEAPKWGNPAIFTDLRSMLTEAKPDLVCVCLPNALHHEAAAAALDAGAHVFCEKPPTTTLSDTRDLERRATRSGRMLGYNFHFRASPEARFLSAVDKLGMVYAAEAKFLRRRGIPGWGSFTDKRMQGGGALIDLGVHSLDLAWYLMGRPSPRICLATLSDRIGKRGGTGSLGTWSAERFEVEDSAFGFIRFENGACLSLQAAWALDMPENRLFSLRLHGERAGASLFPLAIHGEEDGRIVDRTFPDMHAETGEYHKVSVSAFIDACQGQGRPLCPAEDGTAVQAMLEALYRSAETGLPAEIEPAR